MINSPKNNEIDIVSLTRFICKKALKHKLFFKINFIMSIIFGLLFYYYLSNENKYVVSKFKLKNLEETYADYNLQELDLVVNPPNNYTFIDIFKRNILFKENLFFYIQELKSRNIKKHINNIDIDEVKIYIEVDNVSSFRHASSVSDDLFESYIYFIGQISYAEYKKNYIIKLNNLIDHYLITLNTQNSEIFLTDSDFQRLKKAIQFLNFKKEKILLSEFKNNIIEKKLFQSIEPNNNIFLSVAVSIGFFVFIIYIFFFVNLSLRKKINGWHKS
jgi:hypothetical protein